MSVQAEISGAAQLPLIKIIYAITLTIKDDGYKNTRTRAWHETETSHRRG